MSYTKGPWRWKNQPYPDGRPYISVTAAYGYYSHDEEGTGFCFTGLATEDDGALLAAAPDLLEALKAVLLAQDNYFQADDDERRSYLHDIEEASEKARDAIEKATVFERYVHPGPENYDGWFDDQAFRQAA